jgi:hypothetical protein
MIASALPASELEILAQVVGPGEPTLRAELARSILDMKFTEEAQAAIRGLLDKGNRGALSDAERAALDRYLRVGQFIDLLQAKARLSLKSDTVGA